MSTSLKQVSPSLREETLKPSEPFPKQSNTPKWPPWLGRIQRILTGLGKLLRGPNSLDSIRLSRHPTSISDTNSRNQRRKSSGLLRGLLQGQGNIPPMLNSQPLMPL